MWGKNFTHLVTGSIRSEVFCLSGKERFAGGKAVGFPLYKWLLLLVRLSPTRHPYEIHPSIHPEIVINGKLCKTDSRDTLKFWNLIGS